MKRAEMITIDGSAGEGGGQILRTSLALSIVTGKPFRMTNIRAGRKKPGLLRQHLTALNAATEVGDAVSDGAEIGSSEIVFRPERVRPGDYRFAVGTAGSTTLVFQTVLPALMLASAPSRLTLRMVCSASPSTSSTTTRATVPSTGCPSCSTWSPAALRSCATVPARDSGSGAQTETSIRASA